MKRFIIEKENGHGFVSNEDGTIVITGWSKTLGFMTNMDTVENIQKGSVSKCDLDYLEKLYYTIFVTGTNKPS